MGSSTSTNTTITIELDTLLNFVNAGTGTLQSSTGNLYTFSVGNLNPGVLDSFSFPVSTICDPALIKRTLRLIAHIYPDSFCTSPNPAWDGSEILVTGRCLYDSLSSFKILNSGSAMAAPRSYRAYRNNVNIANNAFQLAAGDSLVQWWYANGLAFRVEADQDINHPGNSHPSWEYEACSHPDSNGYGIIGIYPPDDFDPFIDIYFKQIRSTLDENEKSAVPISLSRNSNGNFPNTYIPVTTPLEYTVHFQNKGPGVANTVLVRDALDSNLDPGSFQFLGASHYCTLAVLPTGVLAFTFPNINLPDSSTNPTGSQGWLSFLISLRPGLSIATVNNDAYIYFDQSDTTITNETTHIFRPNALVNSIFTKPIVKKEIGFRAFPNPAHDRIFIQWNEESSLVKLELWSLDGKRVLESPKVSEIDISGFAKGLFLLRAIDEKGKSISLRMMLE